jgi:hypothetical protein
MQSSRHFWTTNMEAVFSTWLMPKCYKQGQSSCGASGEETRVEAGSNTFTVALRVVEGDEKGTQCLGVQLDHPIPGEYIYTSMGTWPTRVGESRI